VHRRALKDSMQPPLSAAAGLRRPGCGDPHALDDGRRLAAYVLRALASLHDEPPPATAAERRALWDRAGIECDALTGSAGSLTGATEAVTRQAGGPETGPAAGRLTDVPLGSRPCHRPARSPNGRP
jgi:Protein of unknown function N-terminus (DUF3323)